jgi:hypothetical protein
MQKILAWTCLACAVVFAAVSLTAVFAGDSTGLGIATPLYAAIAVAAVGMLLSLVLVVIGRLG